MNNYHFAAFACGFEILFIAIAIFLAALLILGLGFALVVWISSLITHKP